jgi:hypothetical protein
MSDDVIFIKEGNDLVPLSVADYQAEAVLQELLERYSQLLAGAQMNRSDPRRFLLVAREAPVADREGGAGRWSIDHLFLDQDAIPTLIEVKRSSDTRIRREVVGQMLDYAANGVRYWAPDQLQALFEKSCSEAGKDPTAVLESVIGESDIEDFWTSAGRNLRGGALRLVFVADVIPDELRRIIEFLNGRLVDTEVYGVEVRRYAGPNGQECYVPRLVGATAKTDAKTVTGPSSLDDQFAKAGADAIEVRNRVASWAGEHALPTVNAPGSFQVGQAKTRGGQGALVRVYPTFRTIEMPLVTLWEEGRESEIPEIVSRIQQLAPPGRRVTEKTPSIPVGDALRNWNEVVAILDRLLELRQS